MEMQQKIHEEFQNERRFSKVVKTTSIEIFYRFMYFKTINPKNGLPVTSHVEVKYSYLVTGWNKGYISHFFQPEVLLKYAKFEDFANDIIDYFIKNNNIVLEKESQFSLF